jgi:hypothetical protein
MRKKEKKSKPKRMSSLCSPAWRDIESRRLVIITDYPNLSKLENIPH